MALHEKPGATDEWYTPQYIFDAMGVMFDLDVASPGLEKTWWIMARKAIMSGSLEADWSGFVWMNPPFGGRNQIKPWLDKFIAHGNGICLVPDRTSAPWWQAWAPWMDRILFVTPKIKFIGVDGLPGHSPAQGTCLGGIGPLAVEALRNANRAHLGTLMVPALCAG